jgi:hypothetical protein
MQTRGRLGKGRDRKVNRLCCKSAMLGEDGLDEPVSLRSRGGSRGTPKGVADAFRLVSAGSREPEADPIRPLKRPCSAQHGYGLSSALHGLRHRLR